MNLSIPFFIGGDEIIGGNGRSILFVNTFKIYPSVLGKISFQSGGCNSFIAGITYCCRLQRGLLDL